MATEMPFTCQYQLPSVLPTLKVELSEWVGRHSQTQCCCCPLFGYSHTFIFLCKVFSYWPIKHIHLKEVILFLVLQHYFSLSLFEENHHRCSWFKWWLKIQEILNIALKQVNLKFFLWTGMEHYKSNFHLLWGIFKLEVLGVLLVFLSSFFRFQQWKRLACKSLKM